MLAPTLFSAWYGGLGPGLLSALLGALSVHFFFLEPRFDIHARPPDLVHSMVSGGMNVIAATLMASVESSRRKAQLAARRIEGIYTVSIALGGTRTIDEVTEVILHEAAAVLGADGAAVFLTTNDGKALRLMAHLGTDPRYLAVARAERMIMIPMDAESPVALAARSRAAVVVEDVAEFRTRFPVRAEALQDTPPPPAVIAVPMIVHGQAVGALTILFSKPRRVEPQDRSWVQTLAQDCGMTVERVRLFERERNARVQAEESARAKDEFLAVVSNELRAPLTTIVGWAHLLKNAGPKDRDRYEHGLDVIERSAHAQARLVEDVLDMSRIVAKKLSVEVKAMDLAPLLRTCVENARAKAAAKGVDLDVGPLVDVSVVGDAGRLHQAIQKILSNAFRFTPPGGHVRVEMDVSEQCALIRVRDDGMGIEGSELPHVLEAFHRRDNANAQREPGLGLGLAIANYIVREHRGVLRVDSAGPGRGTTVSLELPLAEPAAGVLAVKAQTGPRSPLAGHRVLVVDEDTDARDALAQILGSEGADVRTAPSGDAALEEVRTFSPHVIVTDTDMSDRDHSFIRQVRAMPAPHATVPALALTSRTRPERGAQAIEAGYQRQLSKPPQPRELTEAVAKLGTPGD
jgi:K+-sensing histidine kinase KdpD